MAETKTINLEVQSNIGSLRAQLAAAQKEVYLMSEAFGATSKEAAQAALKTAELKDAIADAKNLTDAFNPDAKFTALSNSIGGVLNGFQAYEGAMGLLGVESAELQKTLLKVQSAMALSQGIQGALEAKDSFVQLGAVVKNAFSGMTTAAKAFTVTGIGLLITGIGVLIANYDAWFGKGEQVKKQQEAMAEAAKKQRESIAQESAQFSTLISRLKQTNEGSKERESLIKKVNNQYGTTLKNIKDETAFQSQLNTELASYLEYQKAKFALQANEELIQRNLQKQMSIKDRLNKLEAENNKLIKDGALARKDTYETDDMGKRISTGVGYANEQAAGQVEKNRKEIEKLNDELASAENRFENYGSAANKAQAKVDVLTESGKKFIEQIVPSKEDVEKVIGFYGESVEAFDASAYDINEIDEQLYSDMAARDALEIAQMQAHNQEITDAEKQLQQDLTDAVIKGSADRITQAYEEQKAKEAIQQQNIDFALQGIAIIKSLFEKSKGVQKASIIAESALGIAKMIISNKTANLGALATPLAIATGGVSAAPTIAVNNISTGLGIAANLVATGKALKALGGGSPPPVAGIGGGGGGGFGGGTMAPNFNVVGNSGINQLAQIQQTPMQAYVVSGEVTSAQALDRNRIKNATL